MTSAKVVGVGYAAILALVLGANVLPIAADEAATGSLLVESEPSGASVYVDGRLIGETPLTLSTITAGVHRVRVVRLGFLENSRLVTVKAGAQGTMRARLTDPAPQAAQGPALKIVVLEGEGAVNIVQQNTAVAPIIEVRDRNDQPVSGAVVKFAIQKGKASFDGARTLTVTTDAAGRATATGFAATGPGAVQIATSAAFQGQTAAATIAQTTVTTTAEASLIASGGAASAGGGISHAALAVILGGAGVAGGVFAAKRPSAGQVDTFNPAGTWTYAITANVPLNSSFLSCVAPSSGTTLVSSSGTFSIPFSGLACNNCSASGTATGTFLPTGAKSGVVASISGGVTASTSGSGCSIQQPSPEAMTGTCLSTRCDVGLPCGNGTCPAGTFGFSYTLARP